MTYLLDANVLIRADADYYPRDRIPQFWEWLIERGNGGEVKIPSEIHGEIAVGTDALAGWIREGHVKEALLLDEDVDPDRMQEALYVGYQAQHPDFDDAEAQKIGNDVFLVAYALADAGRTVVTREVSKPNRQFGNRKLPDVCEDCNVSWATDFDMYKLLDFSLVGR